MLLCHRGVRRMGPGSCTVLSLLLVLVVGVTLAQDTSSQIDTQQLLQAIRELRELYSSRGYTFGNKRIPGYTFGLGKRQRQNKAYSFGLGKRSVPVDYDVENESDMPLDMAEKSRTKRSIDEIEDIDEEKRARNYAFGIGKRDAPGEEKRAKSYAFGLGKRDPTSVDDSQDEDEEIEGPYYDLEEVAEALKRADHMYSFGLGKRGDGYNFGLGKRDNSYGFGLGKRGGNDMYGFGLGKRGGKSYGFGLGKRARGDYSFGLGKRGGNKMYSFGLGKRASDYGFGLGKRAQDPYSFGLGKREPYAFGLGKRARDPYSFGLGKREPYAFGLGKREVGVPDKENYGVWRRSYDFGLGKRSGPYSFGIGKRSVQDNEAPTEVDNIDDEKTS